MKPRRSRKPCDSGSPILQTAPFKKLGCVLRGGGGEGNDNVHAADAHAPICPFPESAFSGFQILQIPESAFFRFWFPESVAFCESARSTLPNLRFLVSRIRDFGFQNPRFPVSKIMFFQFPNHELQASGFHSETHQLQTSIETREAREARKLQASSCKVEARKTQTSGFNRSSGASELQKLHPCREPTWSYIRRLHAIM